MHVLRDCSKDRSRWNRTVLALFLFGTAFGYSEAAELSVESK